MLNRLLDKYPSWYVRPFKKNSDTISIFLSLLKSQAKLLSMRNYLITIKMGKEDTIHHVTRKAHEHKHTQVKKRAFRSRIHHWPRHKQQLCGTRQWVFCQLLPSSLPQDFVSYSIQVSSQKNKNKQRDFCTCPSFYAAHHRCRNNKKEKKDEKNNKKQADKKRKKEHRYVFSFFLVSRSFFGQNASLSFLFATSIPSLVPLTRDLPQVAAVTVVMVF
ncbi:hypothetical protein HDV62DRAFT_110620 [Trichoderma sp. SZMC 28011]